MIPPEIKSALTHGLLSGYAGESAHAPVVRGGTRFNTSHLETGGMAYHDEWLPGDNGGGQEIVQVGDQAYTRLYAGGIASSQVLEATESDPGEVLVFLAQSLTALKDQTRLDQDCNFQPEHSSWRYIYQVIHQETELPLLVGRESITTVDGDQTLFVHYFLLSPVTS